MKTWKYSDAMGRVLVRESLNDSGKNTIDLSHVPSGMYVVRLLGKATTGNGIALDTESSGSPGGGLNPH
jgi:hypothetical protein